MIKLTKMKCFALLLSFILRKQKECIRLNILFKNNTVSLNQHDVEEKLKLNKLL